MIGWTLCSGIGAPEIAAPWVDWRLAAEIEPFPRAVLQERFSYQAIEEHEQGAPLLWGDMTEVTPDLARSRGVPLPDLIVAGTPCQTFSISGLRAGLCDERGNLTLRFVEVCHAVVDAKPDGKLAVIWENVPGVLSDKGNAFGCFMGGLVGALDPLLPSPRPRTGVSAGFWRWIPAGRYELTDENGDGTGKFETVDAHHRCSWPSEGMVQGPRARLAWAVLDAQWSGVAQRRRRVFVVVDFGNSCDPAKVLLEPDSLRGDPPTRPQSGQDITGSAGDSVAQRPERSKLTKWPAEVTPTLYGSFGDKLGLENQHALQGAGLFVPIGFDCKGTAVQFDETGIAPPLRAMMHDSGRANGGGHAAIAYDQHSPKVRRLMPVEWERLQGFPDLHTAITYRGRPAVDAARYKALGNSMAVPVLARIISSISTGAQNG